MEFLAWIAMIGFILFIPKWFAPPAALVPERMREWRRAVIISLIFLFYALSM
jgi:hypothetical protein